VVLVQPDIKSTAQCPDLINFSYASSVRNKHVRLITEADDMSTLFEMRCLYLNAAVFLTVLLLRAYMPCICKVADLLNNLPCEHMQY